MTLLQRQCRYLEKGREIKPGFYWLWLKKAPVRLVKGQITQLV